MNRTATLLRSGLAAAIVAFAVSGVDAVASSPPESDGLVRVVDDTGSIAVSIPATWTITTAPVSISGLQFPSLTATSEENSMYLSVGADVLDEDLESSVCGAWYRNGSCDPFDDANLAGYRTTSEECCGGSGRSHSLTANPTNGERVTVGVTLSFSEGQESEAAIFDEVVPTVEVLGSPYPDEWRRSADALAPPQVMSRSFWPYADFSSVPRLGEEPVLGSGCGANGDIGETIPDGLWAGAVTYVADEDRWDVNLMCIYSGAAADDVLAAGSANVVAGDRDYLVVDNNPRVRSVPNRADNVSTSFADVRTDDRCLPGITMSMPFDNSQLPGSQAWIRIHEGAVTWVLFGCDAGFMSPGG